MQKRHRIARFATYICLASGRRVKLDGLRVEFEPVRRFLGRLLKLGAETWHKHIFANFPIIKNEVVLQFQQQAGDCMCTCVHFFFDLWSCH